jgi:hypothetical protein
MGKTNEINPECGRKYMKYNYLRKGIVTAIIVLIFSVPIGAVAQPEEKITICHYPPGNPDHPITFTISKNALKAHLAHGDAIGPCGTKQIPEFPSIAAPVAGVLGLMFLISKMKKKM